MARDILDIDGVLQPGTDEEQARQEERVRASFFDTARRALRYVPFMEDVIAAYYCAIDPKTPSASRGVLLAALAYFVLPFDIMPDFLFGIGFTDDIAVMWAAFRAVRGNIKPEHYVKARETLGEMQP
ncbi:MAG: YkvA family protein [Aurantimonas endophytica]|uniref:Uncharacterized membrane protein YkvA (DUF1232 family) n=1 Tax=Aurantimonas endophytica TaxID=1522175 RepID=A0A7W6MQ89_9HYPH|nr:YkvA family protein [Aurantimonas endophytica]MBB4003755.1 uncharacterized membrane protein YkvA (DUF1232 family) [Aurantimonas endophytica]MCO6404610.1 DUF1232 domain-containing protein [Aurantimonas endophytica]